MADAYVGKPEFTPASAVPYPPPPSSLCPICGHVEADARHYKLDDGRDQVRYVCSSSHEWWTTWPAILTEDGWR